MHFDGLGDAARSELHVEALDLIDGEPDVGVNGRLEPGRLAGDAVDAGGKQGEDIVAVGAGLRLASQAGLLIGDHDFDAGHHGAGGVAHRAGDLSRGRLGGCGGDHAHERREDGERQERATSHCRASFFGRAMGSVERSLNSDCGKGA